MPYSWKQVDNRLQFVKKPDDTVVGEVEPQGDQYRALWCSSEGIWKSKLMTNAESARAIVEGMFRSPRLIN
jgi:hypothetical protein